LKLVTRISKTVSSVWALYARQDRTEGGVRNEGKLKSSERSVWSAKRCLYVVGTAVTKLEYNSTASRSPGSVLDARVTVIDISCVDRDEGRQHDELVDSRQRKPPLAAAQQKSSQLHVACDRACACHLGLQKARLTALHAARLLLPAVHSELEIRPLCLTGHHTLMARMEAVPLAYQFDPARSWRLRVRFNKHRFKKSKSHPHTHLNHHESRRMSLLRPVHPAGTSETPPHLDRRNTSIFDDAHQWERGEKATVAELGRAQIDFAACAGLGGS